MSKGLASYHGADPTGQVDASDKLRFALCEYGGKTEIEAGVYRVNNPIHLHSRYGQRSPWLAGEGQNASILLLTNPRAPAFIVGDESPYNVVRWPKFSGLQIVYETPPNIDVPMFMLQGLNGAIFDDIWAREYRTLMQIGRNADGLSGSCQDIHITNLKGDPALGNTVSNHVMRVENVNGLWIDRSSISGDLNQIIMHFTSSGSTTIDTVVVSDTLLKDGLTGIRAGEGTVSNAIFRTTIFDKLQSVAVQLETAPGCDLANWQFDGCWYHSLNYGILIDQRAGGAIRRVSLTGGTMDSAAIPVTILGGAQVTRTGI